MKPEEVLHHYLPYTLLLGYGEEGNYIGMNGEILNTAIRENWFPSHYKPLLRPLSDLTKEIEHNGDKFVPIAELYPLFLRKPEHAEMICNQESDYAEAHYYGGGALYVNTKNILENQYRLIEKLIEWHFNVFNLPEQLYIKKPKS